MKKNNSEIANLDAYFNRSDIQAEKKKFVANWKPPIYKDDLDD